MSTNGHFLLDDVPKASSIQPLACEHCGNVHIVLFDKYDKPIAYAALSDVNAAGLSDSIYEAVGRVREMKR
jgi:hypothetical protein